MEGTTNPLHGGRIEGAPPPPAAAAVGGGGAGWGSPGAAGDGGAGGLVFRQPRVMAGLGAACRVEASVVVPADLRAESPGGVPYGSPAAARSGAGQELDLDLEKRLDAAGAAGPSLGSMAGELFTPEGNGEVWDRAFVERLMAQGASDGITAEAAQMAAIMLGPLEDNARALDFCRKFLQLRGMGFKRADVCGALVDAECDIDAAVGTCLSLGRGA